MGNVVVRDFIFYIFVISPMVYQVLGIVLLTSVGYYLPFTGPLAMHIAFIWGFIIMWVMSKIPLALNLEK